MRGGPDTHVLPKPDVRSVPLPPERPRKSLHERLARALRNRLVQRLALATAVMVGGPAVYHHINYEPEVTPSAMVRDVRSVPGLYWDLGRSAVEDLSRRFNKEAVVPVPSDVFDNSVKEGVIGESNIERVPQDEVIQQFPTAFEKLEDGKNTLQFEYLLDIRTSTNPTAQITYEKSFSGSSFEERQRYKDKNIYDTFSFKNVPGGTIIRSPVDGYLTLSVWPPIDPTGADNQGALIDFVAPNGNQYRLSIYGVTNFQEGNSNINTAYVFISLTDAPALKPENNRQVKGTYGIPVKKGHPILQLIQTAGNNPIEEVGFRIGAAREGEVGKPIDMGRHSIPTDVELFLTPEGKLISPK